MTQPDPRALSKQAADATPDELLDQIRLALPRAMAGKGSMDRPYEQHSPHYVLRHAIAELDKKLSAGGQLPKAWGEEWGR